ncbi:hypothetical protein QQ045_018359 [Rhodiola kirilowii]
MHFLKNALASFCIYLCTCRHQTQPFSNYLSEFRFGHPLATILSLSSPTYSSGHVFEIPAEMHTCFSKVWMNFSSYTILSHCCERDIIYPVPSSPTAYNLAQSAQHTVVQFNYHTSSVCAYTIFLQDLLGLKHDSSILSGLVNFNRIETNTF